MLRTRRMGRALTCGWVAVALSGCGDVDALELTGLPTQSQSIIMGTAAREGQFPATGALLAVQQLPGGGSIGGVQCTGTLIAPDVVLLAAHCVDETLAVGPTTFYFSFALDVSGFGRSGDFTLPPRTRTVAGYAKHPQFDMSAFMGDYTPGLGTYFDVALAFLESPYDDVAPAYLLRPENAILLRVGTPVQIVGYGQRDTQPSSTLVGEKYFATSVINEVGSTEMQIGTVPDVDPQKCHGDSGGPTYMTVADGYDPAQRLVGITSHTYDETDCFSGGVDTRIDPYLTWIWIEAVDACTRGVRTSCANSGTIARVQKAGPDDTPPLTKDGCAQVRGPSWLLALALSALLRRTRA